MEKKEDISQSWLQGHACHYETGMWWGWGEGNILLKLYFQILHGPVTIPLSPHLLHLTSKIGKQKYC